MGKKVVCVAPTTKENKSGGYQGPRMSMDSSKKGVDSFQEMSILYHSDQPGDRLVDDKKKTIQQVQWQAQ